jgi:hypothetical protein
MGPARFSIWAKEGVGVTGCRSRISAPALALGSQKAGGKLPAVLSQLLEHLLV